MKITLTKCEVCGAIGESSSDRFCTGCAVIYHRARTDVRNEINQELRREYGPAVARRARFIWVGRMLLSMDSFRSNVGSEIIEMLEEIVADDETEPADVDATDCKK